MRAGHVRAVRTTCLFVTPSVMFLSKATTRVTFALRPPPPQALRMRSAFDEILMGCPPARFIRRSCPKEPILRFYNCSLRRRSGEKGEEREWRASTGRLPLIPCVESGRAVGLRQMAKCISADIVKIAARTSGVTRSQRTIRRGICNRFPADALRPVSRTMAEFITTSGRPY
jgi:hypothetical protein